MQEKIIEQTYKEGEIKCWVYGMSKGQFVDGGYLEVANTEMKDALKNLDVVLRIEGVAFMNKRAYCFDTNTDKIKVYRCNVVDDIIVGVEEILDPGTDIDVQVEMGLIWGVLSQFKDMIKRQAGRASYCYVAGANDQVRGQVDVKEAGVYIERLEMVAKTLLKEYGNRGVLPTFFGVYEAKDGKIAVVYKVLENIQDLVGHIKEQLDKSKMLVWAYLTQIGEKENRRYIYGWGDVVKGLSGVKMYKWHKNDIQEITLDDFVLVGVWALGKVIELLVNEKELQK